MAKGDGTIIAKGRNVWEVQVSFGRNPVTGKYERSTRTVHGSKAEARKIRDQMRRDHEAGLKIDAEKVTLREYAKGWLESREESGSVGKTRLHRERDMLRNLCAVMGDVALADISPQAVRSLYSEIQRRKEERSGKRYSGTTMRMLHVLLKQVLQQAVNDDILLRNPCDRVKAPKADEPERRSLSAEDAARLRACVDEAEAAAYAAMNEKEARQFERGNGFGRSYLRGLNIVSNVMAVRLALATGMRRGEILGLSWDCVDADGRAISVQRSLTECGELKPPKSRAGIRTIAVDTDTAAHLERWKERQRIELLKLGIVQDGETPVCCSEKGSHIGLHNFARWWRTFRDDNGFEKLKLHELRHTQATQLLANGVDVKTVQARLGHSNAALTLNWYAHALPENDARAADLIGELLSAMPKETPIIKVKIA